MNRFRDTGCCGFHFQDKGPNLFGLLTLSVPLMLLSGVVFSLAFLVNAVTGRLAKTRDFFRLIAGANVRLINKTPLYPKLRCWISSRIFPVSPRLAGLVYKSFNSALLLAVWVMIVASFVLMI